ncbi:hypothetical protein D3C83_297880 [compost metagenome]
MLPGAALTVEIAAEIAPGCTVTFAVAAIANPSIVAETTFDSATVDAIVPVQAERSVVASSEAE